MRAATAFLALAACGSSDSAPEPGATVEVDGTPVDFATFTASQQGTLIELDATTADGTQLAIAFSASADLGTHHCDEGQQLGLFTMVYIEGATVQFASFYPVSAPAHDCTFELDINDDSTIALSAITAPLASSAGDAVRQLANGRFVVELATE